MAAPLHLPPALWPEIAAALPLPWPPEAVLADLRWWSLSGRLPGVERLRRRWGWRREPAREVVQGTAWHDRSLPPVRRGSRDGADQEPKPAFVRSSRRAPGGR